MAGQNVTITIGAQDNASAAFRKVADALKGVGKEGEKAEKQMKKAGGSAQNLTKALAGIATTATLRTLQKYADTWTNLNNQLRLVTGSATDLGRVQRRLLGLAQSTRQDSAHA